MLECLLTVFLGFISVLLFCAFCSRRRKNGEPPLIKGWIPFLGKALEFRKNSQQFLSQLQQEHGDFFTVLIAGRYITFIMNPFLYPSVIKHGKQLDFHKFSDSAASRTFGYPPVQSGLFPGMSDSIQRSYTLLQGSALDLLTFSMMGNLQQVLRCRFLSSEGSGSDGHWQEAELYEFCKCVMFQTTFNTLYGHSANLCLDQLREDIEKFDGIFPLLMARVPIALLGKTKEIREKLIRFFYPQRMAEWRAPCQFIQTRMDLFQQYDTLQDRDKAAHHFAMLWAAVGNTIPAAFWCLYHLISCPEALEAVRAEIINVVGEKNMKLIFEEDITITRQQLEQMVNLESSINESFRLSSVSMNIRIVQEDFCLCLDAQHSINLRKDDIVALYPQSTHLDPEIYDQPQRFQFDRFVEDGRDKTDFYKCGQKVRYYRMPFGSGATQCPGRFFAMNELKQFVCVTLLMCEMQLPENQQEAMLDNSRAGLGIMPPVNPITFKYRTKKNRGQYEEGGMD
ncbi:25-hydroxycholesterol 7-alpha-hydroxylase-like [Sinocyclocheilus rhinocerous]|uniref:25-hydroxycholesterol 7-alpha-hydroxylase-like n=1 Tax=Sinocyclocheilus rhinocerous TaxID=307959 RepID=UPI0007BA566C|nr:PREDICTED: 25-hydroxycholesterol 7-alpha-hydroxylase-like [Sinocyclocheilus rhinocerous]